MISNAQGHQSSHTMIYLWFDNNKKKLNISQLIIVNKKIEGNFKFNFFNVAILLVIGSIGTMSGGVI